jgi:ADP-ribosylglycohydrolase
MAAIGVRLAADRLAVGAALGKPRASLKAAEGALATLPIALFFYDSEIRQQQLLVQTVQLWQAPPDGEAGLLAIGYAIAQVLKERLERLTLLPQILAYLKQSTAKPTASLLNLTKTLEQVQTLLQHGAGLYAAIEQLRAVTTQSESRAIAIAFYCFLSTPDDLRLSLLRAARSGEVAPAACALTGALSGAHNSLNGLPLSWRINSSIPLLWGLSSEEMNQLAARLFAVWSGVYASGTVTNASAIAAPGVIRPR